MAFTALNGRYLAGKWVLPKREKKEASKEFIENVMLVMDCSHSDATLMVRMGQIVPKDIEACMATLYDLKKTQPKKVKNDGAANSVDHDIIRG